MRSVYMKSRLIMFRMIILLLSLIFVISGVAWATSIDEEGGLGPQSAQALGEKRILMVVVRFPDAEPSTPIETVQKRVVAGLGSYVKEQSYGLASVKADFRGYVMLPDLLDNYKISPYNFRVDKSRLRKLISDTMTAIEKDTDFSVYDHILIIPAVNTMPGKGYGMICYCANPGMLSGVTKRYVPRYETLRSAGGKEFKGGVFVGAENANLGMFAHDYFHALGGIHDGKRLAPCLYDYERQSDASAGTPSFEQSAIYMGPWDIMSQHFVKKGEPPPGISSFTKIRLGWIGKHQVQIVKPGETSSAFLAPLSKGGELLVVKIPLADGTYYLVENRQPIGFDKSLPDSGILILKVNPQAAEGYGTVKVMNAGGSRDFSNAPYKLEQNNRNIFIDNALPGLFQKNGIAIIPLWKEKDNLGVLITTPEHSEAAIRAGRAIQALIDQISGTSDNEKKTAILEAITAFKNKDFEKSYAIAIRKR
jgi:M6 family metalloprotease-like protein